MSNEGATRRDAERDPVSVADLLAKQHGGDPAPDSPEADQVGPFLLAAGITAASHSAAAELLRREGRLEEQLPSVRPTGMYLAVSVLAGLALICGTIAASTTALSGPRPERALPGVARLNSLAGAEALRPDLIDASVHPPATAPATAGATAPALPDSAGTGPSAAGQARSLPAPERPEQPPAPAPESPALPGNGAPPAPRTAAPELPTNADEDPPRGAADAALDPILGTVTTFYETAAVSPLRAFNLLDPQLRGASYQEFQQSWAGVERARVESIRADGPNAALVNVSLERKDGSVLHTLQRVLVIPGAQPRIADAQLLSASRS